MKYTAAVLAVSDVKAARRFYEELFGLELYLDYGLNVTFTCGLSLQQDFGWLTGLPEERMGHCTNNMEICFEEADFDGFLEKLRVYPDITYLGGVTEQGWGQRVVRFYDLDGHLIEVGEEMGMVVRRFLASGMSMEEITKRMDASPEDLHRLLRA